MRIGIDARFFGPRTGGGGLGRYVAELVTRLQQIDHTNEYVLFLRKENFHDCVITNANFSKRLVDIPWYSLAEQRSLGKEFAAAKVDVMHIPHWNVPLFIKTPFLVTLHDLILLQDPASAHATTRGALVHGLKYLGFRLVLEHALHRSRHIIAVSEATKRAALGHFRLKAEKISVIHNGVTVPAEGKDVVLRNLNVIEPYILAVGNHYPHKNLATLIRAFSTVYRARPDASLVLAGKVDAFTASLKKEAKNSGLPDTAIRFVDLPSDETIGALYRNAALLAYPSKIEGFGLPPLEAMACGTPVMASNIPVLKELLGAAARYVDPDAEEDMVQTMMDALEDPEELAPYIELGHHQAAKYSWDETAKKTHEAYLSFGLRRL